MKWPASVSLIRHARSVYNGLRDLKNNDPRYQEFKTAFECDHLSKQTISLAKEMHEKYAPKTGDNRTPLDLQGLKQAQLTGEQLSIRKIIPMPDIIFCSPYLRTKETLRAITQKWPQLKDVSCVEEDRLREQEHGLSLLYSDWRLFHVFNPEQKILHDLQGPYWYKYPQGESVLMVRDRTRDVLSMLIRECEGMHVMLVTHHLTILSMRANIERLTDKQFIHLDEHEKPVNCGVTHYYGNPMAGKNGKLTLNFYNKKLY